MAYDLLEAWEPLQSGSVVGLLGYGWNFTAGSTISTTEQRSGTRCLFSTTTTGSGPSYPINAGNVKTFGLAFKYTGALQTGTSDNGVASFLFSSGSPISLKLNNAGVLVIIDNTSTVIGTGSTILGIGVYNFVEMVIDNVAGTIDVYLNNPGGGIPVPEVSASFTPRGGLINTVQLKRRIGTTSTNVAMAFDDIYVDDAGLLYGDSAVLYDFPSSDGVAQDWTPSSAPAWERINNVPVDAAQYIEATTAGDVSTFGFDGYTETIFQLYGVALITNWLRTGASAETARVGPNISGTDYFGAAVTVPQTTAEWARSYWELNPATSAAWVPADVQTGFSASLERVT